MSDYTPSDSEMREAWVSTYARDGWLNSEAILRGQREFRAWLAARDAETAAKALEEAAQIADAYAGETRTYRDNETDYPESWFGMQVHGQAHGAQDAAIRIRARAAAIRTQQEGTE